MSPLYDDGDVSPLQKSYATRLKQVILMRLMGRQNVKRELRVVTRLYVYELRNRAGSGSLVIDEMNIFKQMLFSLQFFIQVF